MSTIYSRMGVSKKGMKPGDLMMAAKKKMESSKADKKMDKKMKVKEGSKKDMKMDKKEMSKKKEVKKMKPKGAMGKAQVKKLGRTYKTGGFAKIAKKAGKEYGSKEAGKKVAGAIFQKMVAKRKGKK